MKLNVRNREQEQFEPLTHRGSYPTLNSEKELATIKKYRTKKPNLSSSPLDKTSLNVVLEKGGDFNGI